MSALTLTLTSAPDGRLDLSALTPAAISGLSNGDIGKLPLGEGASAPKVGDHFRIAGTAGERLVLDGATGQLDLVGARLDTGTIVVEGDVGAFAAANMRGGRLEIAGSAGAGLGAAMRDGIVHVRGNTADSTGGIRFGERYGMQGGTILVEGNVGPRAGDRMRRGTIIARGNFGAHAGARMMGGTLWAEGGFGDEPGIQMRRGTLIAPRTGRLLPTFRDGGVHDLVILRILSRDTAQRLGSLAPKPLPARVRKLSGDLAIFGKGELLLTS
ncbi:MAG: formylmethanofuran dehydrogenase subunit C [Hyphomicrobiaceae bacterium]